MLEFLNFALDHIETIKQYDAILTILAIVLACLAFYGAFKLYTAIEKRVKDQYSDVLNQANEVISIHKENICSLKEILSTKDLAIQDLNTRLQLLQDELNKACEQDTIDRLKSHKGFLLLLIGLTQMGALISINRAFSALFSRFSFLTIPYICPKRASILIESITALDETYNLVREANLKAHNWLEDTADYKKLRNLQIKPVQIVADHSKLDQSFDVVEENLARITKEIKLKN
ncbi:hypothetical protein PCS_02991 [Desulfocurvibacter africanus PCS]|uniref:Uncharacterized protein n=1 Tax=Desulfocurvibacter africanus PCS TaxID=1262666 RepID=M5Q088_DESAF|nr:hypothetical protein [Desulfocurvibacter africanus]EMG36486.1 hypothetical protein PCS_02991 [Desulfocurvibacter africanus PCS]